jgi:integrase
MPEIDGYTFGRVTIDGREETHDVIVLPERVVRGWWRKEGHRLVLEDLDWVLDEREEPEEINPPTAAHLESVFRLLPPRHRLAFLFLDWSGARVSAVDLTLVSDYDEPRRRVRLRAATTKTRKALWVELHPALADALERQLGSREDRNPDARLFAGSGADALRTSIAKACRAAGVPQFSPHDLRHRRISLLHLRGVPWARIGEFVGQRNLSVTADVYSHVLGDETELDYAELVEPVRI